MSLEDYKKLQENTNEDEPWFCQPSCEQNYFEENNNFVGKVSGGDGGGGDNVNNN